MTEIQKQLFSLQDLSYRSFHAKLMPTIAQERIIGIRVPILRKLSKEICGTPLANAFLLDLPHHYYEENNLHAFLLGQNKNFEECVRSVDHFLPYVDNWATCDSMRPKCFLTYTNKLEPWVARWLQNEHSYTVRFGIEMRMNIFLGDAFRPQQAEEIAAIRSEEYYVNMMVAWYFATALAKRWDNILPFLTLNTLPVWTHNKTIQKAVESNRITPQQKVLLKTYRRKND